LAKFELHIFGDESTAPDLVTYGLMTFPDATVERRARYAWTKVMKNFGSDGRARVHARVLFSGDARKKSEWAHLDERSCGDLTVALTKAICGEGAFFSLGVVHPKTFPPEGMPDGLNEKGEQKYHKISTALLYGFGFWSAAIGLRSNYGVMRDGDPYKLFMDPLSETVKIFSDWKAMQIQRFMQVGGLQPTPFSEKPQLLDAADIFAYASARALSDAPARNKEVCKEIHGIAGGAKTDYWWNPENFMNTEMVKKLN
jgi:hypothetical protein